MALLATGYWLLATGCSLPTFHFLTCCLRERINGPRLVADALSEEEMTKCAPNLWTPRPDVLETTGEADEPRSSFSSRRGDP